MKRTLDEILVALRESLIHDTSKCPACNKVGIVHSGVYDSVTHIPQSMNSAILAQAQAIFNSEENQ